MLGFEGDEVYRETYYEEEIIVDDGVRVFQDTRDDETEVSLLQDVGELLATANNNRPNQTPSTPSSPPPSAATTTSSTQKWTAPSAPQEIQAPTRPPESPDAAVPNAVQIPQAFDQSIGDAVSFNMFGLLAFCLALFRP